MGRLVVVCVVLFQLSNDGLHPNPQGYAVMAPLAEAAIAANFKRRK